MLGSYKSICLASPVKPSLALYSPLLLRIGQPVCGYGLWQGIWPLPEEIRPSTSPLQGPHPTHTPWSSVDEWPTTSINLISLLSVQRLCMLGESDGYVPLYLVSSSLSIIHLLHHFMASYISGGGGALCLICKVDKAGEQSFDPPLSVQNFPSY